MSRYLLIAMLIFPALVKAQADSASIPADTMQFHIPPAIITAGYHPPSGFSYTADSSVRTFYADHPLSKSLEISTPVFIKNYGPSGIATPSFHGMSAGHTRVYWNGIPLDQAGLGMTDLSVPGTQSADAMSFESNGIYPFGLGGAGGTLLLESRDFLGEDHPFSVKFSGNAGSFHRYGGGISASYGRKKGRGNTRFVIQDYRNDFGYWNVTEEPAEKEVMKDAERKQMTLMQQVGWKGGKKGEITVSLLATDVERNIPPPLVAADLGESQRDRWLAAAAEYRLVNQAGQWQVLAGMNRQELNYSQQVTGLNSHAVSGAFHGAASFKSVEIAGLIRPAFTLDFQHQQARGDGWDDSRSRQTAGLNAGIHYDKKLLTWSAAYRLQLTDGELTGPLWHINSALHLFRERWIAVTPKFSASGIYRPPTLNDLYWQPGGNENLRPESGLTADAGIRFEKRMKQSRWTAYAEPVLFFRDIRDWIQWQPTDFGYWQPANLKHVQAKGFSLATGFRWRKGNWEIHPSIICEYTRSTSVDASDGDASEGKQLIYVPEKQMKGSLVIRKSRLSLSFFGNYTGKRFISSDASAWLNPFLVADAGISYTIRQKKIPETALTVKMENMFNYHYHVVAWRPMPGRSLMAGITVKI